MGGLLTLGVLVGVMTVYQASYTNMMNKLGLVGADFSLAVKREQLRKTGMEIRGGWECGLPNRIRGSVEFMLSGDSEQGQLAFRLGQIRLACGAGMLERGEVETGTYEIMKGLGYLADGYRFVVERGSVDLRACEGLPGGEVKTMMDGLLSATSGRVHELLYEEWGNIVKQQGAVAKMCLDERMSRQ